MNNTMQLNHNPDDLQVQLQLKDGRQIAGQMWEWKPREGWFSMYVKPDHSYDPRPQRFDLSDVESGTYGDSDIFSRAERDKTR